MWQPHILVEKLFDDDAKLCLQKKIMGMYLQFVDKLMTFVIIESDNSDQIRYVYNSMYFQTQLHLCNAYIY